MKISNTEKLPVVRSMWVVRMHVFWLLFLKPFLKCRKHHITTSRIKQNEKLLFPHLSDSAAQVIWFLEKPSSHKSNFQNFRKNGSQPQKIMYRMRLLAYFEAQHFLSKITFKSLKSTIPKNPIFQVSSNYGSLFGSPKILEISQLTIGGTSSR